MERLWDGTRFWLGLLVDWPRDWPSWVRGKLGLIKERHDVTVIPYWRDAEGNTWMHPNPYQQGELLFSVECGWCGQIGMLADADEAFRFAYEHTPNVGHHIYDRMRERFGADVFSARPS
jgi:hypothetical protein